MKKTKRLLALLVAVLLCLSLCGCDRLDEMRKAHGFWQKDGSILLNGHVYKKLPSVSDYFNWDTNREDIFVTDVDVPVLLSMMAGEPFSVSKGEIMLDGYDRDTDAQVQYCRADKYDMVCTMLTGDFEVVTYGYYYYEPKTETYKEYVLTASQKEGLAKVYATAKKREQTFEENGEYDVSISGYSSDNLFCRLLFNLVQDEKGKFTLQDDEYIYDVPKAAYPLCQEILKVYMESLDGEGPVSIDTVALY